MKLMIWCKYEVVDGERDLNSLSVLWHSRGEQKQDANLFLYRKTKYFSGAAGEWVAACWSFCLWIVFWIIILSNFPDIIFIFVSCPLSTILINVMLYQVKFIAVFYQLFGTVQTKILEIFWTVRWCGKKNDGGRSCVLFGRGSIRAARIHVIGEEREGDDFVSNSMFQVFPLLFMTSVTCKKRMNKSMKIRVVCIFSHEERTRKGYDICWFLEQDMIFISMEVESVDDGWHSRSQ